MSKLIMPDSYANNYTFAPNEKGAPGSPSLVIKSVVAPPPVRTPGEDAFARRIRDVSVAEERFLRGVFKNTPYN